MSFCKYLGGCEESTIFFIDVTEDVADKENEFEKVIINMKDNLL